MSGDARQEPAPLRRRDIIQRDDAREQRETIEDRLTAAIDECAVQLGREETGIGPYEPAPHAVVAEVCRTELLPHLAPTTADLLSLDDDLSDDPDWYWNAIRQFHDQPVAHEQRARLGDPDAERIIERAFYSLEAAAAEEGPIEARYTDEADAMGFHVKLGIHKQKPKMNFGDPVKAITRRLGALKSLYSGGTAGGKSSGASRQVEDYYRASLGRGRDYKIFDPIGLNTENVNAYGAPLQDERMRRVREEDMGLPPSWAEAQEFIENRWGVTVEPGDEWDPDSGVPRYVWELVDYRPDEEILVPLTPDLKEYELPYDLENEEYVPTPFSIPMSDFSEGLVTALITSRVSSGEERAIRQAYKDVDRQMDDWGPYDLKRAINSRQGLSDSDREAAVRIIENLADAGFIRTADCPYALDDERWRQIFHSTDVATVVNQTPVETKEWRYLIVAHLIEQIWRRRYRAHRQPMLVMWLRELHKIAPHQGIYRKQSDVIQSLMEHIIVVLGEIQRMPRDINTHIVADTQNPNDPEKGIRQQFNRYVVFGGSASDIDDIFDWANQDGADGFRGTVGDKPGRAGIIKGCEPAISSTSRWGISPVHLCPPSWHHHDKDEGPSGWQKRVTISQEVDVMPDQELRAPTEWDLDPPEPAGSYSPSADVDEDATESDDEEATGAVDRLPTSEVAKLQARQMYAHREDLSYSDIAEEIPNNPETGEPYHKTTIGDWVSDVAKGSGDLVLDLEDGDLQ